MSTIFLPSEILPQSLPQWAALNTAVWCPRQLWYMETQWGHDSKYMGCLQILAPKTTPLQQNPVWKWDNYFFLVGVAESRGWELERRRRVRGWETNKMWFIFRKLLGWIFQNSSYFFKMHFLRSPTPDTPVPSFQPRPLHHYQPGEGAVAWQWSQFSWISFTVIFINLNAQGAEGDWRKLVFPLVSLWLLRLIIPGTGSWRNVGRRHSSDQSGCLTLPEHNWLGKASGLHNLLPLWWFSIKRWMGSALRTAHP